MTTAIQIEKVEKHFGQLTALKGVDLTIQKGEFFGLLGPNGAGKSTLINIVGGLTRASAGRVRVCGNDVWEQYREARRAVGIVPQELVFDAFFTVREMLEFQSGYFGLGKENGEWIDTLLDALKLTDKRDTNMRALSGGMKRRVLIAQALVHRPEVVILDEPTAGVDVELRALLWDFIKRMHRDGHTIVLTTHYLEEAEVLCDRIAILNHGRIVALDSKRELLAREYGRSMVLHLVCSDTVDRCPQMLQSYLRNINGNMLVLEIDKDRISVLEVLKILDESRLKVIDLRSEHVDLEDIFLKYTTGASR